LPDLLFQGLIPEEFDQTGVMQPGPSGIKITGKGKSISSRRGAEVE